MQRRSDVSVWCWSVASALFVGVASMSPLLFIILDEKNAKKERAWLRPALGFAVGALLGDVFLHLVPEAGEILAKQGVSVAETQRRVGFWLLLGVALFALIDATISRLTRQQTVTGLLNLLCNAVDNALHGVAVASAFLASKRAGLLTTLAVVVHEVPHELADFAILLSCGFDKKTALKSQLLVACTTVFGAAACLLLDAHCQHDYSCILLLLTAGGFLHIALVGLWPKTVDGSGQLLWACLGVLSMAIVGAVE